MSRNAGRLSGQTQEAVETAPDLEKMLSDINANQTPVKTFNSPLEFIVATEHVDLPSQGRFYSDGHPLFNQESVEIKFMTATEENILTSQNLIRKGLAIERLLQSIIVDKSVDPASLLSGDRNAILLASRITGFGSDYTIKINCPNCSTSQSHTFDLALLESNSGGIEALEENFGIQYLGDATFSIPLLRHPNIRVAMKLLTGKDEFQISTASEKKKKLNINEGLLLSQFDATIVAINEFSMKGDLQKIVATLPAIESRHLRAVHQQLSPRVIFEHKFECNSCGFDETIDLPITTDFFWPKNK